MSDWVLNEIVQSADKLLPSIEISKPLNSPLIQSPKYELS